MRRSSLSAALVITGILGLAWVSPVLAQPADQQAGAVPMEGQSDSAVGTAAPSQASQAEPVDDVSASSVSSTPSTVGQDSGAGSTQTSASTSSPASSSLSTLNSAASEQSTTSAMVPRSTGTQTDTPPPNPAGSTTSQAASKVASSRQTGISRMSSSALPSSSTSSLSLSFSAVFHSSVRPSGTTASPLPTTAGMEEVEAKRSSKTSVFSSSTSSRFSIPLKKTSSGWLLALTNQELYRRERFGYSVPIIDPAVIIRPSQFSLSPKAIAGNLLLAIVVALTVGLSGVILRRLIASDEKRVKQMFGRLPFQALLTLFLVWLYHALVPDASAQGFVLESSVSLLRVPFYAFLFFLVVGTSNYLFNNILNAEGDRLSHTAFHPLFSRFLGNTRLSEQQWFIVLLLFGYGIVGAHINPEFSLLPGRQLGIIIIVTLSIMLSACLKDGLLYVLARFWQMPGRFKANLGGFVIAVLSIVFSRMFALSPGYIYGVPLGLLMTSQLYHEREGFFEFLDILWILIIAGIAWVGGTFLNSYPVPFDLSNLLFVMLVEDAFFELIPLPYLAGGSIFAWRKLLWFLECIVVVFFLFHTLFNPEGTVMNLAESPPAALSLVLLGCYAIGVFLLWASLLWGRREMGRKRNEEASSRPEDPAS